MASGITSFGKGALRVAKNYTKGYSDTQTKVREATSNDPWGPSGTQMNDLAQLTYNQTDFVEIMEMLDKRLNDKGKNWRHVFKALTLLDYILHAGSENVVIYFKDNLYIIKTLKEFVYVDDEDKDVGANVRQKAKDITNLLQDEARLREERRSRGAMQDRMAGVQRERTSEDENNHRRTQPRPGRSRDEDSDLQRAIANSMNDNDDDARRRRAKEEADLAAVLALSEKEEAERKRLEEERKKQLDEQNSKALFDDSFQMLGNNAYQQPMQTGFQQPMQTGWGQPQFNPFYQQQLLQQQQEEAQRQAYLQMQYQAQQEQAAREQAAQQAYFLQQQQAAQQQMLMPQPTGYGSNNPFAFSQAAAPQMPQFTGFPSPAPQPAQTSFFTTPTSVPAPAPSPVKQAPPPKDDGANSHLAMLLANREDGLDTFGNVGNLRMPARHNTGQNNPFGRTGATAASHKTGNLVDF